MEIKKKTKLISLPMEIVIKLVLTHIYAGESFQPQPPLAPPLLD